ncbi:MAG: flagellar motor protein MotB [Syntrophothermus sp.]
MENRKRQQEHSGGGHDGAGMMRWLLTYADLITLLMAFFVVMFAISQVDVKKYQSLAGSLQSALSIGTGKSLVAKYQGGSMVPIPKPTPDNTEFAEIVDEVTRYVEKEGLSSSVNMQITDRGLVIGLSDTILFESGRAELLPPAQKILDKLAVILLKMPNHVRVEGHTDNQPIRTLRYPSNWQLSTDRATNVIMYWLEKYNFPPQRLSAAGYGEYRPVDTNANAQGRARNRRVDIVVLRGELTKLEPK